MRFLIALFLIGSMASCSGIDEGGDVSALDRDFFNLEAFVVQQEELLAGKSISKSVSVNSISETHQLDTVDWELELAPFAQSNIDRPAMWDSYEVDSFSTCGGRDVMRYTSLDSSNFTKSIEVVWSDKALPFDSVYFLTIENGFESFIADTKQELVWWNGGYEISSTQEAMLSEKRKLDIKGTWDKGAGMPCE